MPSESRAIHDLERLLNASTAAKAREVLDRLDRLPPADRAGCLVRAFSCKFWDVRKAASEKLAGLGAAVAVPAVEQVLEDSAADENALYWSLQTLGGLDASGGKLLLEYLPRCPGELRTFAIRSLGRLRFPEAVPVLVDMLNSPDYATREEAARVLAEQPDDSVGAVRHLLNSGTADQKFWAFKILAKVMGVKAVEPLTKILKSPGDEQQGAYALAALKEIRHPAVIPTLVGLLSHESWYYRAEAAEILQGLSQMAVPELKRLLDSENPDVRFWCMKILREILAADVVPLLERSIQSDQKSTRYSAVLTLAGLRDSSAARLLIRCFQDDAWVIRKLASDSLGRQGDLALKYLIDNLSIDNEESLFWTLATLGKIGDDAAEPSVALLLDHPAKTIRLHAVDSLAGIGSEAAMNDLVGAFRNSLWVVRQRAAEALARVGDRGLKALLVHVNDADGDIAYWTEKALSAFNHAGLARLVADIKRAKPDEREAIMRRLQAQPAPVLGDLLKTPNAGRDALMRLPVPRAATPAETPAEPAAEGAARAALRKPVLALFDSPGMGAYPMSMDDILLHAQKCGASDLHLKIGCPPILRIHGILTKTNFPVLTPDASRVLASTILTDQQKHVLAENLQVDLSYEVTNGCRFRINLYKQTRGLEAACRYIDPEIPSFKQLNLPEWVMQKIGSFADGLVLVTGPTGCGKSTTIAALLGYVNRHFSRHVITIEDPIEYVHQNVLSYISYREVGMDVHSFPLGLRGALREDPDVILIGELRDRDTISTALTLAGTGHLVLSTFHTSSASQTVEQIVDFFPTDQQSHVRRQLAFILRAVLSQRLFTRADGRGRVPAVEILLSTNAVRNLVRDGNTQQLYSTMQASAEEGMTTFDASLMELVGNRLITYEDALPFVVDQANFKPKGGTAARGPKA
ncbi:MAG: PilT/PilU family type 4a pilus ATPase [Candidatus Riflebacteria bacterium]|nr:PilT/PilU family type 4a pilus ATPase [Candidatus Riflebacteria bacterium]